MEPYEPLSEEEREAMEEDIRTPPTVEELTALVKAADDLISSLQCSRKDDGTDYSDEDIAENAEKLEKLLHDCSCTSAILIKLNDEYLTSADSLTRDAGSRRIN